jgi:O-Antigen ligase
MDRRVLLTRRHAEVNPTPESTPESNSESAESTSESAENSADIEAEAREREREAELADLTPTPQEVAEVVFVGRRIGKRRRSEILRDLADGAHPIHDRLPARLIGELTIRRSFHAVLALASVSLLSGVVFQEANRGGYALELWVTIPDIVLAFCAAAYGFHAVNLTRKFRSSALTTGGVLLVTALLLSFMFHPSLRGVAVLVRLLGAVGVADRLQRSNRVELRRAVQVLTGGVVVSLLVGIVQLLRGRAIGLYGLGERGDPFFHFGDAKVPAAFLGHPYPLGGAALVAASVAIALALAGRLQTRWLYAAGALGGFGCVFSGSRTNILGIALLLVTVVAGTWRSNRMRAGLFAVAVIAACGTGFAANPSVWEIKSGSYKADGDVSAGRVGLFKENVGMVRRYPILGVGPGRYNIVLEAEGVKQSTGFPHPPQVVGMSALAEGGVLAGVALFVIVGSLVGIAKRKRLAAVIPLVGLAAPLFGDHYMWSGGEGMALVAIGFGVAYRLSRESQVRELR